MALKPPPSKKYKHNANAANALRPLLTKGREQSLGLSRIFHSNQLLAQLRFAHVIESKNISLKLTVIFGALALLN